jgi:YVTN family beta-propeller protein
LQVNLSNYLNNEGKTFGYDENFQHSFVDNLLVYGQTNEDLITSGFDTGSYPIGIAVNPLSHKIYVADEYSNTVSVFNTITDKLEQTIKTGVFPYSIDINIFNNRIYVTNRGSNDISVIDGSTNLILDKINVGLSPVGITVDPSNNYIYVTNIDSNSISIIDGITNKVINTINNIPAPYGINVDPLYKKIYVTNIANSTITVIDNKKYNILKNIPVGRLPVGIDIDIEKNLMFVTNYLSNSLSVINGTNHSIIKTIGVGKSPVGVKINPVSKKIYISNMQSNTITVLNESNFNKIKDIVVNPSLITTTNEFPFNKVPTNIKFPLMASYIAIDPLTNLIYVTNTASNTISLISGKDDENIVRVNFKTNPENAGFIECDGIRNSNQNAAMIIANKTTSCKASADRGYSFKMWSGLESSLENPLKFTSNDYGTIIANFKPTLSFDQYIFLIGGITGFTSIILGWFFKGRQRRKFNKFMQIINDNFNTIDNYDKDKIIYKFEILRQNIFNSYKKGSLTDFQFDYLDRKILNYIEKISKLK